MSTAEASPPSPPPASEAGGVSAAGGASAAGSATAVGGATAADGASAVDGALATPPAAVSVALRSAASAIASRQLTCVTQVCNLGRVAGGRRPELGGTRQSAARAAAEQPRARLEGAWRVHQRALRVRRRWRRRLRAGDRAEAAVPPVLSLLACAALVKARGGGNEAARAWGGRVGGTSQKVVNGQARNANNERTVKSCVRSRRSEG
eukprot:351996-Chlamydomonas_euryale.AAC.4